MRLKTCWLTIRQSISIDRSIISSCILVRLIGMYSYRSLLAMTCMHLSFSSIAIEFPVQISPFQPWWFLLTWAAHESLRYSATCTTFSQIVTLIKPWRALWLGKKLSDSLRHLQSVPGALADSWDMAVVIRCVRLWYVYTHTSVYTCKCIFTSCTCPRTQSLGHLGLVEFIPQSSFEAAVSYRTYILEHLVLNTSM